MSAGLAKIVRGYGTIVTCTGHVTVNRTHAEGNYNMPNKIFKVGISISVNRQANNKFGIPSQNLLGFHNFCFG